MGHGASMPVPRSDPQRDNLYWLESEINGWWAHSSATTRELESLLVFVCKHYNVEAPRLKVVRRRSWKDTAEYDPDREEIILNRCREGANAMVLCHEATHYLTDCFYTGVQSHGPEFVAIYMHLLDHFCFLPHRCFRLIAKTHRLKIARRYRPIAFRTVNVHRPLD